MMKVACWSMSVCCLVGFIGLAGCQKSCQAGRFGEPLKVAASDTVPAADVLANPQKYEGQVIRVRGTVREVCKMKGCWLTLGDKTGDQTIFVRFTCPSDGMLIPQSAVGHQAMVEGELVVEEVSADEAEHMAKERGLSASESAGAHKRLRLASAGAEIEGLDESTSQGG